jgi:siroheme synthase
MATMIDLARAGLRVVRLKSGDPFVFGRGGEEAEALARAGVPFEIVPGITAANGCAAGIGVPLTHRDLAHSVRLVTGRLRAGAPEPDWRALAAGAETLVVYMGLRSLGPLCASLRAAGVRGDLPLALVQNGTRAEQRVALGKLDEAEALARGVDPSAGPTLLILGDVVALAKVGKSWRSAA